MSEVALVWCPFPDEAEARAAATALLDEGLIGCANIIPGMLSLFVWQGERGETQEVGALFKTDARLIERAIDRLAELHSYDTPAITGWIAGNSAGATKTWLGGLWQGDAE